MAAPIVAITGPSKGAIGPRFCVALAIRLAGGKPWQLRPGDRWQDDFRAVVITGGHDINPVLYAEEPEVMPKYDEQRDAFESAIIDTALERDCPLLGICRGAQLLNVRRGGTLFQDIRSRRRRTSNRRTLLPTKHLSVEKNSRWLGHWSTSPGRVNSLHNQAVDRLGDGLNVVARDEDGLIQAVEDPSHSFVLGVQWHPEFLLYLSQQRHLFRRLVEQAS
ncbi:peptidase C26 [Saccharospirillum sp. MSK14-1]|uniref:gamma-glutamyl-gamma-aminobutyrate hydrolase family protein n=1 Tax=Saccharospirillum sp. MSK14-1 TaxID=1897632 RepID=UPI000D334759|nr:gamma-glutamyl-gamma-aminobutyrate hydrolase family protein [Saccharospirillum sp. MSK14-1]PTY36163.1 peptidase C26 [Saccharospirillum sp. MSK14-1]